VDDPVEIMKNTRMKRKSRRIKQKIQKNPFFIRVSQGTTFKHKLDTKKSDNDPLISPRIENVIYIKDPYSVEKTGKKQPKHTASMTHSNKYPKFQSTLKTKRPISVETPKMEFECESLHEFVKKKFTISNKKVK
jgi:hypothetical protein